MFSIQQHCLLGDCVFLLLCLFVCFWLLTLYLKCAANFQMSDAKNSKFYTSCIIHNKLTHVDNISPAELKQKQQQQLLSLKRILKRMLSPGNILRTFISFDRFSLQSVKREIHTFPGKRSCICSKKLWIFDLKS